MLRALHIFRLSPTAIADLQSELQRSRSLVRLLEERERERELAPTFCIPTAAAAAATGVCSRALSTALLPNANANSWVPPPPLSTLIRYSTLLFS